MLFCPAKISLKGFKIFFLEKFTQLFFRKIYSTHCTVHTLYFHDYFLLFFLTGFYIAFQSFESDDDDNPMPTMSESTLQVFIMSLGGFGNIWNGLDNTNHAFIGQVNFDYSCGILK